ACRGRRRGGICATVLRAVTQCAGGASPGCRSTANAGRSALPSTVLLGSLRPQWSWRPHCRLRSINACVSPLIRKDEGHYEIRVPERTHAGGGRLLRLH